MKTATFECLSNLADASYIWEKKDGEIAVQAIGADASRLVIPNIAPSDSGDYRCIATSLLGENATSVYATLEINGKSLLFTNITNTEVMQWAKLDNARSVGIALNYEAITVFELKFLYMQYVLGACTYFSIDVIYLVT